MCELIFNRNVRADLATSHEKKAVVITLAITAVVVLKAVTESRKFSIYLLIILVDINILLIAVVNVRVAMMDLVVSKRCGPSVATDGHGIRRWKCARPLILVLNSSLRNRMELYSTTDRWFHRNRKKPLYQVCHLSTIKSNFNSYSFPD